MNEAVDEENVLPAGNVHAEPCIYTVPERLRQVNDNAYTPQAVSIGPIHHGVGGLLVTEGEKGKYLRGLTPFGTADLERSQVARLRNCYAYNTDHLNTNDFVNIILNDARFIIGVLLRYRFPALQDENDIMLKEPRLPQMRRDFKLLENQVPFFFLESIFDPEMIRGLTPSEREGLSVMNLSYNFFRPLIHIAKGAKEDNLEHIAPRHFVDLLRSLYVKDHRKQDGKMRTVPSVRELQRGDVKFELLDSGNWFDIDFPANTKVLKIPKLIISDQTEITIRNVLAFEQCHHILAENYMTDYVVFLDRFLSTEEDVRLLVKKKIVKILITKGATGTISPEGSAKHLIGNLTKGFTVDPNNFYFAEVCQNVDKYCRSPKILQKTFTIIAILISITANILQAVYCAKDTLSSTPTGH